MFDRIHEMRSAHHHQPELQRRPDPRRDPVREDHGPPDRGPGTAEYLWSVKSVVPFLKVDKGLADEADGAQVMKPMPDLDPLLERARAKGVFGTKMRSVIKLADEAGVDAVVDQQFEVARQILAAGLVPIIEPEVDIHSPQKAEAEVLLKAAILAQLDQLAPDQQVMLKLTLPEKDGFYADLVEQPRRPPGRRAVRRLHPGGRQRPPGPQPGRDRQLLPGPHRGAQRQQSDEEFDAALDASIKSIYEASIT